MSERRHNFQRRILDYLRETNEPIDGTKLAEHFGQTRTTTYITDEFREDLWLLLDRGVIQLDKDFKAVLTEPYKKKKKQ